MRDAQSAFDQVIAFAGTTHRRRRCDDGARPRPPRPADGHCRGGGARRRRRDLRARGARRRVRLRHAPRHPRAGAADRVTCCSSASIPRGSRIPEIAAESERDRLRALAAQFSSEDLMRAFDVLTKADYEIRGSTQPRYHLELALAALDSPAPARAAERHHSGARRRVERRAAPARARLPGLSTASPPPRPAVEAADVERRDGACRRDQACRTIAAQAEAPPAPSTPPAASHQPPSRQWRRIRRTCRTQGRAPRGAAEDRRSSSTAPSSRRHSASTSKAIASCSPLRRSTARSSSNSSKAGRGSKKWSRGLPGARCSLPASMARVRPRPRPARRPAVPASATDQQSALKQKAMADSGVQAMLDVFRTDIKEVEEI